MASFLGEVSRHDGIDHRAESESPVAIKCKHGREIGLGHHGPESGKSRNSEALLKISLNKTKFYQFQRFLNTFNCDNALSFCVFVDIFRREEINSAQTEADFAADTCAKARAIFDTFCSKGSPFSVDCFNKKEVEKIEKRLLGTVGNHNLTRNLFTKLHSRCLVELEMTRFQTYLSSEYYEEHSRRRAIQVVPCATLDQVLKHRRACDAFVSFLKSELGSIATKAKQQVVTYKSIIQILSLSRRDLEHRGKELLLLFFGMRKPNKSGTDDAHDASFPFFKLKAEFETLLANGELNTRAMLQKLLLLVHAELRDRFFAGFVESPYYLHALRHLSGVGYEQLVEAISRLGVRVAGKKRERRKVFSQQIESLTPVQQMQRRRSTSATLFGSRNSTVFSKRYTLKRATRVHIAPELSKDTVCKLVKLNTTPRDWKYPGKGGLQVYPGFAYRSFKPPGNVPFIVFGLEGVLANKSCLENFFGFCKQEGRYCCGSEIVELMKEVREAKRNRQNTTKELRAIAKTIISRGVVARESWFNLLDNRTMSSGKKEDIIRALSDIEESCMENVMSVLLPRYMCFQQLNRVFHYAVNI